MHKAVNGTLRHFADDRNLLIIRKYVKKINREINYNLRLINYILIQVKQRLSLLKQKQKKLQNISVSD